MNARLVTAYVPIPGYPCRTPKEYGELGEKLSGVPVRKKAFYNKPNELWLTKYIAGLPFKPNISRGDYPEKNTLLYHAVNHQKSTWLVQAADAHPDADWLVWVDYGIFSQPNISNQIICEMFDRVERTNDQAIYAPGCWDKPLAIEASYPCWRFCGSVIAVPRKLVDAFDYGCRVAARKHISSTKNVCWEINTWAKLEATGKLPFHWYKADHNATQFTSFPDPAREGSQGSGIGAVAKS
jgi:hypothetical protein